MSSSQYRPSSPCMGHKECGKVATNSRSALGACPIECMPKHAASAKLRPRTKILNALFQKQAIISQTAQNDSLTVSKTFFSHLLVPPHHKFTRFREGPSDVCILCGLCTPGWETIIARWTWTRPLDGRWSCGGGTMWRKSLRSLSEISCNALPPVGTGKIGQSC